ncbi:MAG: CsgG/HfaB family protein [Planctomycetota bacterium]
MRLFVVLVLGFAACASSCASTGETASADTLTSNIGMYPPGPAGVVRPRIAIPSFSVSGADAKAAMNDVAADQMSTLFVRTQRFNVIERAQLDKLLAEQDLTGIVTPGEMAKQGAVQGVDYLVLGKVSNLRTKVTRTKRNFGLGRVTGLIGIGAADMDKENVEVKTDCGVDLRLVDPSTGAVVAANFSEYSRSDSASSMGLTILGVGADASADLQITEDDYGKILRLALDDAVRKLLPDIDQMLVNL